MCCCIVRLGEVNGKQGAWGHAVGGMGAITQAMASAAGAHGVRIDVGAAVREVIVERDRATGVVLADGTAIRARAVIANVNPQHLFQSLLPPDAVPGAMAARMKTWKTGSGTFRMNLALAKLPDVSALPGVGDHHTAGIIMAPSLTYMDQAYRDCVRYGWSRAPIIEMLIPSSIDDTLAPPGAHVASLFCQHVAPQFSDGSSWDQRRETVADLMIDTVETYAPGFKASVIGRQESFAVRPGARVRPAERRHFPRRADARSAVFAAPDARLCGLPHAAARTLSVRLGCAPRRRRDRCARTQRGAGGDRRSFATMNAQPSFGIL